MSSNLKTKASAPKTGIEFLASSHFEIGKEPKWLSPTDPNAYKSTFQSDYPQRKLGRIGLANITPPALIMHKDDSICDQTSLTRKQFTNPGQRDVTHTGKSLTKTNFKMDRDDRIKTFLTTSDKYYQPPCVEKLNMKSLNTEFKMESHIPQGDKGKVCWPQSDYKSNFIRKSLTRRKKIINDTMFGPNTIKGDLRSHGCSEMFNTSSRREFPVRHEHQIALVPEDIQYPKTHIPSGDNISHDSTHQNSFRGQFPSISAPFDRKKALSELQKTTFRNGDERLVDFRTTTDERYRYNIPTNITPFEKLDMGKSSFPEGDKDPIRSVQRIRSTVNRSDYKSPPKDYHNYIVDGSKIQNVSSVTFGNDTNKHYQTTMETNYSVIENGKFQRIQKDTTHSSIPLNYYGNVVSNSSYRIDYLPRHDVKKLRLNALALNNLRQSHIGVPIHGLKSFSTTHSDTFTLKSIPRPKNIDVGRLQKSSIPIGTLQHW